METHDQHIEGLLFGYFSEELTDTESAELLQWLQADVANEQLLAEMADWWATAHVPLFMAEKKSNFEKHFGSLVAPAAVAARSTRWNFSFLGKVAASAWIVLSVGSFGYFAGKKAVVADEAALAYFETVTPLGSTSKVLLPDHTVVWVNAGSSLKYSKDFSRRREVSLDGEAYFEVAPDSLKPFVVKSEQLDIQVLGTCFNVKAYSLEERVDVALASGKVKVRLHNSANDAGEVTLAPERMLSYDKETNCVKMSAVASKDVSAWTGGRLRFVEQPFAQIARDLERKYDVQIHIESRTLDKEIFSGSFEAEHSLDHILREVDIDHKYVWTRKGNDIIIGDKRIK